MFIELFDEFGDLILFFGGGEVFGDFFIVESIEEGEEGGRVEVSIFDVELNGVWVTLWTSCCVISASQCSTADA